MIIKLRKLVFTLQLFVEMHLDKRVLLKNKLGAEFTY